jgi:putative spermidine/putrescine transport system permease protein
MTHADQPDQGQEPELLRTADGLLLQTALNRVSRRAKIKAFLLVLPLLAFILVSFVAPIGQMLLRSVNNDQFYSNMPELTLWFADKEFGVEPDEMAFTALAADLTFAAKERTAGSVGTRVNYDLPGSRSLFTSAARKAKGLNPPFKDAFIKINKDWVDPELWAAMHAASATYTSSFYLAAVDRKRDTDGSIIQVDENRRIYVQLFWRTLWLSGLIAVLCLLLGFPVAHLLATLPMRKASLLMILVLLPFWTSLLVRTTAWMVILQGQGVFNNILVSLGIVADDNRLELMYNQTGSIVAMTHILLPFMILPLYSVMRTIPPSYARAARSLGATSWTTFRRIYLPQTIPGIGAGGLLVFILAVGYYITPALVGGASGQLISNQIAFHMQDSLNWSMASALAAILLAAVLVLYWLYDRLIGIDNMKLG